MADAVVVGSGPNGLVCANMLADAGWEVVVVEAAPSPGGAVSSSDYLGPGFVADVCSAFYPLAAAAPPILALGLEDHGLRWRHAPAVLAHPLPDGRAAVLSRDLDTTVGDLERLGPGDGRAWRRLYGLWEELREGLLAALFTPFPPVGAGLRLAKTLGPSRLLRFARFATLPVRHLAEEEFVGPGSLLVAGCALHTDLSPESAASCAFGWLLAMLGQDVGFPVPVGGAGQLTAAMVRRLEARGGKVICGRRVRSVTVRKGRAVGVVTDSGETFEATQAVMADVSAQQLYGGLVAWDQLPPGMRRDMGRFQWDYATVKVDWALDGRIPWEAKAASEAGTVHLADSLDDMTQYCADIAQGRVPARPFVVLGQMTTADPSRSPEGTEVVWAYTHVPRAVRGDAGSGGITGSWGAADREAITARVEDRIEQYAPGFKSSIRSRHLACPPDLEAHDANLVNGAINGGTSAIHQQLVFRPTPGLGRPETPIPGLYLASSSAHPGGGVHGGCGANAARAALRSRGAMGRIFVSPALAAGRRVFGDE
ncbi:MAG TPA: NAD(P)/FAD-dependent oxidoreductase [Acidimicrobiales bacterium]|jgi:phytoene dehydrogenase-like protein|nr:NAD(P)/FAD-dependent oxidoreductase [Acidimicrobiales bacterium]